MAVLCFNMLVMHLCRLPIDETTMLSEREVQDAIGLCLNKADRLRDLEFKGSNVVEACQQMLADKTQAPPVQIMRTLLLASRTFGDVLRYMLSEAVPTIVRRRGWESAPRVWSGVLHAVKKYFAGPAKDGTEGMLRALLGLPPKQLSLVLQVCAGGSEGAAAPASAAVSLKAVLTRLIQAFSATEREEVLSGRWVGLQNPERSAAEVEEKLKLLEQAV
jgi:hypothetical protein